MSNVVTVSPDALALMGATGNRPEYYAPDLSRWMTHFGIDTPERAAHFLGQGFHECAALSMMREGRSQFVSSHGTYSGRGFFQLTHESGYRDYREFLYEQDDVERVNVLSRPGLVETLPYSVHSAGWYWTENDLSQWADGGLTEEAARYVSMAIACGPRSVGRNYCTYQERVSRSDCEWRHVSRMGMRSVCTYPNGWFPTRYNPGRWARTQAAFDIVERNLVTFRPMTATEVAEKSSRETKAQVVSLAKRSAVARPSSALGLKALGLPEGLVGGLAAAGLAVTVLASRR